MHATGLISFGYRFERMHCSSLPRRGVPTLQPPADSQAITSARQQRRRWRVSTVVSAEKSTYSGKGVSPPAKGHHFLHIDDFSTDEIRAMLETAAKVCKFHPP